MNLNLLFTQKISISDNLIIIDDDSTFREYTQVNADDCEEDAGNELELEMRVLQNDEFMECISDIKKCFLSTRVLAIESFLYDSFLFCFVRLDNLCNFRYIFLFVVSKIC